MITTVGDEDEDLESSLNLMTSSPASLALQTPPGNVDIESYDEASVIISGAISGALSSSDINATSLTPKSMRIGNVSLTEAEKMKASMSRDRSALARAVCWKAIMGTIGCRYFHETCSTTSPSRTVPPRPPLH